MLRSRIFKSSRLFLYFGLVLVFIAIVSFTTTTKFSLGAGFNTYGTGWLFAPVIGVWGLASLALWIMTSASSKEDVVSHLLPLFALMCTGLAFATWMAIGFNASPNDANFFWWIYFGLFLAPSVIAGVAGFLYFTRKEKLVKTLSNPKTQVVMSCLLASTPLVYTAVLWIFYLAP